MYVKDYKFYLLE